MPTTDSLLRVNGLRTYFKTEKGPVKAVDGVSFEVARGERLGIVGESGSGKSVTALSIMQLVEKPAGRIEEGSQIHFKGRDLLKLPRQALERLRGHEISMVFQDPLSSLNPLHRVGAQIEEAIRLHTSCSKRWAKDKTIDLLHQMGIPRPEITADYYPHNFSGGMRQRAMIAMALSCGPDLVIADEPTTALDVTIQAQIQELLVRIARERNIATILITHDMGLVAGFAERILVMYAGRIVESGPVDQIFYSPRHPYTWALMKSLARPDQSLGGFFWTIPGNPPNLLNKPSGCAFHPRCEFADTGLCSSSEPQLESQESIGHQAACHYAGKLDLPVAHTAPPDPRPALNGAGARAKDTPLFEIKGLTKHFLTRGESLFRKSVSLCRAVDNVSFEIGRGESLGLVGESGCGKSTIARTILRLLEPSRGALLYRGQDIAAFDERQLRKWRRTSQLVFQDPLASLDPRMALQDIVAEPLRVNGLFEQKGGMARVLEVLGLVGLNPEYATRFPHEFSGGEQQRISIARALILEPELIVCDEPVSALDVSIRAQILNLLKRLQAEFHFSYLFISHDLSVVRQMCDRVVVMYLGKFVETGYVADLYDRPCHPYTQALLSAVPIPDPKRERERIRTVLPGDVPSPVDPPSGCAFHPRCPKAQAVCSQRSPALMEVDGCHAVACYFAEAVKVAGG